MSDLKNIHIVVSVRGIPNTPSSIVSKPSKVIDTLDTSYKIYMDMIIYTRIFHHAQPYNLTCKVGAMRE